MGKTVSEKIFSTASGVDARAGDIVLADVDLAMAHDGTAPLAIKSFKEMNGKKVWNKDKVVLVIDHISPSAYEGTSNLHKNMRYFAQEQGITNFYDVGSGVCHQLVVENHVEPGFLVVGADSHTCTYGALGAFSTGIGSTEMAAVFLTGKLWFKVPATLRFNLSGSLPHFVTAKDIILYIAGQIRADGATYNAIEFSGEIVKSLSIDERLTLCNMAVEMGGKTGLVEADEKTLEYFTKLGRGNVKPVKNDTDANFAANYDYNVSNLSPQIACPPRVDNVKPVKEVQGLRIDQVFLGSCTNGRYEDLEMAARIIQGKKVAPGVRMLVVPASRKIFLEALKNGLIEILLESGCVICNPGCGVCVGGHQGVPASGEVVLSTSNRNFVGRMGCAEADIYLCSPITATVSAVEGRITDPCTWEER
ncbi:MAG: 3-isopropylmalate dehydratase large subunit [Candidatus Bathyarchaeota archaeon]